MTTGMNALLGALPVGVRRGADTRGILISVVQEYDATSGRVLAAVGEESTWLLAVSGTYTVGDLVAVLRNPWTGRAELVLGRLPDGAMSAQPPTAPIDGGTHTTTRHDGAVRIVTTYLDTAQGGSADGH